MSLVDYEVSDDEDDGRPSSPDLHHQPQISPSNPTINPSSTVSGQTVVVEASLSASISTEAQISDAVGLPNVSELLGWMGTAGGAPQESIVDSRKRPEINGSVHLSPHKKVPRGRLPPSRIPPDTAGGQLLPPQLRGRSNIATEDLGRLFVRHQRR